MTQLRFFWNGIKGSDGRLQKCRYSKGNYRDMHPDTVGVTCASYDALSSEICAAFDVKNDSDYHTDYFDKDRFYVEPSHPLYADVHRAWSAARAYDERRALRRALGR